MVGDWSSRGANLSAADHSRPRTTGFVVRRNFTTLMPTRWTEAEMNQLHEMAGDLPRHQLAATYKHWAKLNGYPSRSSKAIFVKAYVMGLSLAAIGESLTTGGIAKILEINDTTVQGWMVRHPDLPRRKIKGYYYIKRRDLAKWALEHPHLFGGLNHANLMQLFESEDIADYILNNYPNRPVGLEATARPIRCITTNQLFPSLSAAARATHMTYQAISLSIRQQREACGLRFEFINGTQVQQMQQPEQPCCHNKAA